MFDVLKRLMGADPQADDGVQEVMDRKKRSVEWLSNNFYTEWEEAYRNYKLHKAEYLDEKGQVDLERFAICLPDTNITVRRFVARVTAQIPQIGYRADDENIARAVSRTLMWQWDKSQMQRIQKRNVLQAGIFGWSVVGFDWETQEYNRRRKIQLFRELHPFDQAELARQYNIPVQALQDPVMGPQIQAQLAAKYGRGSKSVPVSRMYRAYVGPQPYFMFAGDCFPEPDFESIQTSSWFIVERRRTRQQLDRMGVMFPEFRKGIAKLYEQHPMGSDPNGTTSNGWSIESFRKRMRNAIAKVTGNTEFKRTNDATWNLTFEHTPGRNARLRIVGENNIMIGSIPYPFSLDGKIAFAETEIIPELTGGIGDSSARLIRPLQKGRNEMFERRMNLVKRIETPLVVTRDKRIYENPDLVKRGPGFRIIYSSDGNPMEYASEQAAAASAAASMAQDSDLSRNIQMASGESNLTLMAGVDAQQARTATGSRLMQQNMDTLSRSDIRSYVDSGVAGAVEVMFLMNASEMTDAVSFDPVKYDERWAYKAEGKWLEAHPYIWQGDGTLTIKEGSTLADDDEASLTKSQTLWAIAMQRPDRINVDKAAEAVLEAMGERSRLQEWILPQQPPPPPEPPKRSISLSVRAEDLPPEMRMKALVDAGLIETPPPPEMQQQPPGDPGMSPDLPMDIPPEIMQELLQSIPTQ